MFLSDISLKRPIAMTVVLLVLALFGFLAWRTAGVDLVPLVDVPYVTVTVVYPGATPEEIETAVVRKIEDAVSQVDGLKHMTATCANNFCQQPEHDRRSWQLYRPPGLWFRHGKRSRRSFPLRQYR